jgi:hypothetical protein
LVEITKYSSRKVSKWRNMREGGKINKVKAVKGERRVGRR